MDLTGTQVTALLDTVTSSLKGLAPASAGGTVNFLRADGTWAAPPAGGGIADGNKGDITLSGTGTVMTINAGIVTNAKAATMPTLTVKGNNTGATAAPLDLTVAQTKTLLAIANTDVSGLGSLATKSTIASADITDGTVANVDLANMGANTVKGSVAGGVPIDLTVAQQLTMIGLSVPVTVAQGGTGVATLGSGNFLQGNGTSAVTSTKVVPGGVVVGTSDTQTLTNKTIIATLNAQVGTTYTLVLTDAGKLITLTNAAAITLSVPTNASVGFLVGTTIDLAQLGAGKVTVAAVTPGTTTVSGTPSLGFRAQYSAATLIKTGTDTWLLVGDLA
jgi:hypothetical protein